jgi:asparagine synthase (glutamine-hydrolysing)
MSPGGRAAGFALVWDPGARLPSDLRAWRQESTARILFSSGPVTAYALPATFDAAHGAEPASWSNPGSSAVWLGELHTAGRGDAASVLKAAVKDDGVGFEQLEGLFCVAMWDEATQQCLLYRDGSATRGLYWYRGAGWAIVASQLEILVGMPNVPRRLGPPGLHEYLRFLDVSPPNTIYQDIYAIEPSEPTWFDGETMNTGTPNAIDSLVRQNTQGRDAGERLGFEASIDALDDALREAVAARLERDANTGVFLSGGIDSALLCAIAADIARDRIEAFTLGFDDGEFDESRAAAGVAQHLSVRHQVVSYTYEDYAQAFDGFLAAIDLPFADPAGLPTWLLYGQCCQQVEAVLDGTGADTLLGVMPARNARFSTQYPSFLPVPLRRFLFRLMGVMPGLSRYAGLFDFDAPEDLLIRWRGWKAGEIEALCGEAVDLTNTRFYRIYRAFPADAHLERYSALMGNLPDDRVHQAAQATGLRIRFPYGDARVADLVRSLPHEYLYSQKQPKRLLRELLARYVPAHLWDQPKHGFDFPFVAFMRHDEHAVLRRYLASDVLERHGLLHGDIVEAYLDRFIQGDDSLGFRIWGMLVLFGWLESRGSGAAVDSYKASSSNANFLTSTEMNIR